VPPSAAKIFEGQSTCVSETWRAQLAHDTVKGASLRLLAFKTKPMGGVFFPGIAKSWC
jgi:hypothetical protein